MTFLRNHNRKGFGYIVAIGMLGLLGFMGLFLMQSSSAEYSQTSLSLYRTMGRQIAEAAADEAAVIIEEQLKEKKVNGPFDKILEQASKSLPCSMEGVNGKTSTAKPIIDLNDLSKSDLKNISDLLDYHITRAGFSLDKIHPAITCLRPVSQGPLDNSECYYCPTDRASSGYSEYHPFDNEYSRDWWCTLQLDITVSLAKQKKTKINYQISRDIKIVNVGPIARNYTFFSILGTYVNSQNTSETMVQADLRNRMNMELNKEKGRLFLWNHPFQSRVYLHGPAIIDLENSNLVNYPTSFTNEKYVKKDKGGLGAFLNPSVSDEYSGPGFNMAYQYDDSFYGFSYYPDKHRGLFPKKSFYEKLFVKSATKEDDPDLKDYYAGSHLTNATRLKGGIYPKADSDSFLKMLKNFFDFTKSENPHYYVGEAEHQKFLPAGPFCRTPWRFVPTQPIRELSNFRPNQKDPPPSEFPKEENKIYIEHRWDPRESDNKLGESTQIFAMVDDIKYDYTSNSIDGKRKRELIPFCVNYFNETDPEGFWGHLKAGIGHIFEDAAYFVTFNFRVLISVGDSIIRRIPALNKLEKLSPEDDDECINLFPTNFKLKPTTVATKKIKSINDIPRDKNNNDRWILNGIYWIDSAFTLERSISYVGTGTLIITGKDPMNNDGPLTFKGNIIAARDNNNKPLGHLTIYYDPGIYIPGNNYNIKSELANRSSYSNTCKNNMLTLDGGVTIEASVFSALGVRSINGFNATTEDFLNAGMNPRLPFYSWYYDESGNPLNPLPINVLLNNDGTGHPNIIKGNYCNYYFPLAEQGDDLWILHDTDNPFMFKEVEPNKATLYQEFLDFYDDQRIEYERMSHELFMSPKIQHVGIIGAI